MCTHLQYDDGILVIRFDNSALVPDGKITVEGIVEEEDDEDFLPWHIAVIVVASVIFLVLVTVIVSIKVILHGTLNQCSIGICSNVTQTILYICRLHFLFMSAALETWNPTQRYQFVRGYMRCSMSYLLIVTHWCKIIKSV